jgi:hypothetical protein
MTNDQIWHLCDSLQQRQEQTEARVEKLVTDMNAFRELALAHLEAMAKANAPKQESSNG